MKIYIVSDTHHSNLLIPLYRLFEKADMVVHLGDGFREAQDLAAVLACPVVSVRGNCDYDGKDVQIIEINGHVLFVHMDIYTVLTAGVLFLHVRLKRRGRILYSMAIRIFRRFLFIPEDGSSIPVRL